MATEIIPTTPSLPNSFMSRTRLSVIFSPRNGDDGPKRTSKMIAIAIRSIFAKKNNGFVQAGAGIVFDSIAENELKETEHKANAMITALKEATK